MHTLGLLFLIAVCLSVASFLVLAFAIAVRYFGKNDHRSSVWIYDSKVINGVFIGLLVLVSMVMYIEFPPVNFLDFVLHISPLIFSVIAFTINLQIHHTKGN